LVEKIKEKINVETKQTTVNENISVDNFIETEDKPVV